MCLILRPKEGAVEPANGFLMHYEVIEKNRKHLDAIAKAVKKATALYLATDPDREGEAIAWHIVEWLNEQGLLSDKAVYRVAFHEITKKAVTAAVAKPSSISNELVEAQKGRRAIDYLFGFNLSPLVWRMVRGGLSAGRVQSPALRLIVEREEAIEAFKTKEYWTLHADALSDKQPFTAKLSHYSDEKLTQFSITDEKTATKAQANVIKSCKRPVDSKNR